MAILTVLMSGFALAGVFNPKTTRGPWPDNQVSEAFVLPKGWLQLELSADSKFSRAYRDGAGDRVPYEGDTAWRYSRLWLKVDQGFSKRIRLYAHIPWVQAALRTDAGAITSTTALGDVHTGVTVQPWLDQSWAAAFRVDLKAPIGVEWPSDFVGGPENIESFLTGTGITNLGAFAQGRYRFGNLLRVDAAAGYIRKFPGIVGYVVQTDGFGNGWLDPGDDLRIDGAVTTQVAPRIAVSSGLHSSFRQTYRIGVAGPDAPRPTLGPIAGTAGHFVDGWAGLSVALKQNFEVAARMEVDLLGSDTRTFAYLGLEEFSPQPGVQMGLSAAARW